MQRSPNVLLVVTAGPMTGSQIEVTEGGVTVGRTAKSQVVLAKDTYLSGLHFRVAFDGHACLLRDERSANGTLVNGRAVSETNLCHGDLIDAGQSRFLVQMETAAAAKGADSTIESGVPAMNPLQLEVARQLAIAGGEASLFVLLDPPEVAAVSVLGRAAHFEPLMEAVGGHRESYLVQLEAAANLLPEIVPLVWGRSRAVFLTSGEPFEVVRRHLRAYGLTRTADGRTLRFRFHDPRMLQLFLDSCSAEELTGFFGPVRSFLCEDFTKASHVLEYSMNRTGLRRSVLRLGTELARAAGVE